MPELPEMETYRRLLTEKVVGKCITEITVQREKSINIPVSIFKAEVEGSSILEVTRRAKHIIFSLNNGKFLLLHLMLGGWMYYGKEADRPNRTAQVVLSFGEYSLYFIGLRLGYLHLLAQEELEASLSSLGPEPLDPSFTEQVFRERYHTKRGILKPALVDQKLIAGIGNCYSDEICFHAAILPQKRIGDLKDLDFSQLYQSIRFVLGEAVEHGGYMESPLYEGDKITGGFDPMCKVYDRGGEACIRCGHMIQKDQIASRKAFYCSNCQH